MSFERDNKKKKKSGVRLFADKYFFFDEVDSVARHFTIYLEYSDW